MTNLTRWKHCLTDLLAQVDPDEAAGLASLELAAISSTRVVLGGIADSFWLARIRDRFLQPIRQLLESHFADCGIGTHTKFELWIGAVPKARTRVRGRGSGAARERVLEADSQLPLPIGGTEANGEEILDPTHRFSSFHEGPDNRSALEFARQIAENPGTRFNPLVLVGASGHGKTHLLHAIAHELRGARGMNPVYTTAEAFANAIWDGIKHKQMAAVRERFRQPDALLVDGVEFLQVTPRAQEELAHTIDALHGRGAQLVFAMDRYPKDLNGVSEALRSRLEMGLIAEVGKMDIATRLKMVRERAHSEGIALPTESMALLSQRITSSPRKLEGAVVRIGAYAALMDSPITAEFVERIASPLFDTEEKAVVRIVPAEEILLGVCGHFGIKPQDLRSRSRSAKIQQARRVAIHVLRRVGDMSYPRIGALLGNRTHSTIIQAERKLLTELREAPVMAKFVETLIESLSS